MPKTELEQKDRRLLNLLQSDFPLCRRPWSKIGEKMGISEEEVIRRTGDLKRKNYLREVSAIFDTRRMGYSSSLIATKFHPQKLHAGARFLSAHPGISHNYARNGYFNLWFTLATPPGRSLEEEAVKLGNMTGAEKIRVMPTIRFFKIGVNFDMEKQKSNAHFYRIQNLQNSTPPGTRDKLAVMQLQEDLALEHQPFDSIAENIGVTLQQLFTHMADMQSRGLMRRYGAVLHHRRAGFSANAMVVWNVPESRSVQVGEIMASNSSVSHCYQRPRFPDWRFSHFTMIHATSKGSCEEIASSIEKVTSIRDKKLLYSSREYKKARVRYFVEDNFDAQVLEKYKTCEQEG